MKKDTQKSANRTAEGGKKGDGFTAEERAAMKERAKELKASANKAEEENAVIAKIDELPEPERTMATRLHAIIKANAPGLSPKTWYGMPAYAKDGKILCFFQSADKFETRYSTLGFNDIAMNGDPCDPNFNNNLAYSVTVQNQSTPPHAASSAVMVRMAVTVKSVRFMGKIL